MSSRPAGGRWLPTVSEPGGSPSVAIDAAGNVFVAWFEPKDEGNSNGIVNARVLSPKGTRGTISQLSTAADGSINNNTVRVGTDVQGNAVAIWASTAGLRSSYRPASSAQWLSPVTIDRYGFDVSLDVNSSGRAIAAWSLYNEDDRRTVRVVLGENGRWEIPATVGVDRTKWTIPSKVSASVNASGAAVVAWSDIDHGNGIVSAAYRDAGDSAWSVEKDLSFVDGQASSPATGIDRRGDALVVWDAAVDVEGATRSAGGVWERPTVVGAEPGPPLLAVGDDGNAIAAWTTGETGAIKSASRSRAAPIWKPLGDVAPASQGLVDIELNSAGDALAMWAGRESALGAWVAGMDAAGPVFDKVRVPSSGYAGQRLVFAANAVDTWSSTQKLAWDFGDGSRATGDVVAHTYDAPGTYRVAITANDSLHHESRASRSIVVKRAVRPRNNRRPSIAGSARIGTPVACRPGRWSGTHPIRFAYQWLWNGSARPGPAGQRVRLRAHDAGSVIACRVIAANYAGSANAVSRARRVPAN